MCHGPVRVVNEADGAEVESASDEVIASPPKEY